MQRQEQVVAGQVKQQVGATERIAYVLSKQQGGDLWSFAF